MATRSPGAATDEDEADRFRQLGGQRWSNKRKWQCGAFLIPGASRRSLQGHQSEIIKPTKLMISMARPTRFERVTFAFGAI
jgi:hypothetical protein